MILERHGHGVLSAYRMVAGMELTSQPLVWTRPFRVDDFPDEITDRLVALLMAPTFVLAPMWVAALSFCRASLIYPRGLRRRWSGWLRGLGTALRLWEREGRCPEHSVVRFMRERFLPPGRPPMDADAFWESCHVGLLDLIQRGRDLERVFEAVQDEVRRRKYIRETVRWMAHTGATYAETADRWPQATIQQIRRERRRRMSVGEWMPPTPREREDLATYRQLMWGSHFLE